MPASPLIRFEDLPASTGVGGGGAGEVVLVLCAAWCGTCRGFETIAKTVAERSSCGAWAWIDIEDAADALPSLDVETFPSLAVVRGGELRFYGPILPDATVLDRTVRAALEGGGAPVLPDGHAVEEGEELVGLARRVEAWRQG
ncbi:thioredoxin-like protein [Oryzomicrobium terrae]|uniref:Thioredoxin-like protein n=1 Tax=Oryzomicrobium terrae TaxID=1735038 RepID=A0A5C1E6G2_9RHOO|nr:thioredoxin family protein [Oryzomicrobium terrae]QEL64224.1 thioredoxin-like protein [Oryzomicrobium terrae]